MQHHYSRRRSLEEKAAIVAEYQTSTLSREEIARKYGVKHPSSISKWQKDLSESKKSLPLQSESHQVVFPSVKPASPTSGMDQKQYSSPDEELKALREELARTKSELDWERKRSLAFETLINVAEEHGMHVKKYGAKQ